MNHDLTLTHVNLNSWRLITARKRSLWRLCFNTCLSVILFMRGECVAGGVHAKGEGACMAGGMHGWGACMCVMHTPQPDTMQYSRSMSGQYASYWNAFLFQIIILQECIPVGCILSATVAICFRDGEVSTQTPLPEAGTSPPPQQDPPEQHPSSAMHAGIVHPRCEQNHRHR